MRRTLMRLSAAAIVSILISIGPAALAQGGGAGGAAGSAGGTGTAGGNAGTSTGNSSVTAGQRIIDAGYGWKCQWQFDLQPGKRQPHQLLGFRDGHCRQFGDARLCAE
jgi:hypothetical protein